MGAECQVAVPVEEGWGREASWRTRPHGDVLRGVGVHGEAGLAIHGGRLSGRSWAAGTVQAAGLGAAACP